MSNYNPIVSSEDPLVSIQLPANMESIVITKEAIFTRSLALPKTAKVMRK